MFFFKNSVSANYDKVFYDFQLNSISGELIDLKEYKNKVILVVNTASYCGFTKQYDGLQKLWEKYKSKGMSAYSEIQENEFAREKDGYTSVKHQREVGTSYFDAVSNTISSGKSSTTAMEGSTESEQF